MATTRTLSNGPRLVLVLLLLAGFGLRLHELTRQDIWWDEARNIDVALRPFLQVAVAPELDIHPPIYFWLLHAWARLSSLRGGEDPIQLSFFTRFLSVYAGILGIGLVYQLTRQVGGVVAGLGAATLAAFSPIWLAESQETRMYTVGFALLMAAGVAFLKMIAIEGSSAGERAPADALNAPTAGHQSAFHYYRFHIAFVLLSALALLTHYNVVFILVAWYLWWGGWALTQANRWRRLRTVLICGMAMTLLVLPVAPIALRQIPTYANPNLVVPSLTAYLGQNWQAYLGGYAFESALLRGGATPWLWSMLFLLVAGLGLAWTGKLTTHLSFLLVWLLGGLALYYVAVVDRGAFNVRYSSFITPALYALFGIALAGVGRIWKPLTAIGLAIVLIGLALAVRADIYDPDHAREDVTGLTEWLRANADPDDVIFIDQKYPFDFYYPRYAIDTEETMADGEEAPARYLFVDINTIDRRLNEWASDAEKVFWVQWYESDTDPRRAVPFLLDKEGQHGGEQWFRGYSVDWWTMTPPSRFELSQTLTPVDIRWPPALRAVEAALPEEAIVPGETLFAVIRWQRDDGQPLDWPLKARVGLYDDEGSRVAQSDERVLNDRHLMPGEWTMEDQPLNVYRVETADDLEPGTYMVRLLVYDADTLEPLSFVDEAGNPAGVETMIGEVEVE